MISSYLNLLERHFGPKLDSKAREYINFAADGAKRLNSMITDLLTYSRVGTEHAPFLPTDYSEVLSLVLERVGQAIKETGTEVTSTRLPVVLGNRGQLEQVFQNLVLNALKYKSNLPPRVHVSATVSGNNWVFSVADNGIGIDPANAERVFGMFQRVHKRSEVSGTGIGLTICKKIIEQHGGRIWVESSEGNGATFLFTLPDAVASSSLFAAPSQELPL